MGWRQVEEGKCRYAQRVGITLVKVRVEIGVRVKKNGDRGKMWAGLGGYRTDGL